MAVFTTNPRTDPNQSRLADDELHTRLSDGRAKVSNVSLTVAATSTGQIAHKLGALPSTARITNVVTGTITWDRYMVYIANPSGASVDYEVEVSP